MAKALLGYVGGADLGAQDRARALRRRVDELEAQVSDLEAERDALSVALREAEMVGIPQPRVEYEPAFG